MESTYTCLRCIRALGSSASIGAKTRRLQIPSITRRSFASSQNRLAETKPARARNIPPQNLEQRRRRSAHTATAQVEEPANFERHNQRPHDFGDYRAHAKTILRPDNLFHPFSRSPI